MEENNNVNQPVQEEKKGLQTAAMVLGIISIVLGTIIIGAPLGLLLGIIGLSLAIAYKVKKGKKVSGLVLSIIGTVVSLAMMGLMVFGTLTAFNIFNKAVKDYDIYDDFNNYDTYDDEEDDDALTIKAYVGENGRVMEEGSTKEDDFICRSAAIDRNDLSIDEDKYNVEITVDVNGKEHIIKAEHEYGYTTYYLDNDYLYSDSYNGNIFLIYTYKDYISVVDGTGCTYDTTTARLISVKDGYLGDYGTASKEEFESGKYKILDDIEADDGEVIDYEKSNKILTLYSTTIDLTNGFAKNENDPETLNCSDENVANMYSCACGLMCE